MPLAEVKSESPNCLSNLLKVAKDFEERQGGGGERNICNQFLVRFEYHQQVWPFLMKP